MAFSQKLLDLIFSPLYFLFMANFHSYLSKILLGKLSYG
jgi:hypothetical protein